jgi:phosphoglycolate phosphatase
MEAAMREAGFTPDVTWIVGDTTYDIEMGRLAGCRGIGVSYGNHPAEALTRAGATHIVERIDAVLDHL